MHTVRLVVAGLFAMLVGSIAFAAACDGFTDVDDGNTTYCSAVTYLKDKGITLGCTGTAYCPNDYVTRLQMALLLQRMGRGGASNALGDWTDTIGGGVSNTTDSGVWNTVGGGIQNRASGNDNTVSGGSSNAAFAAGSVVAGGDRNTASGFSSAVLGGENNIASGDASTVLGGSVNTASGAWALAAGAAATADQDFCGVFSFWSLSAQPNASCGGISFVFRIGADRGLMVDYHAKRNDGGGTRYVTIGDVSANQTITAWNGAALTDGGTWANASDVALKAEFTAIDPVDVLQRVTSLPIASWRYLSEAGQRHVGPTAQDFYAAFSLGADDKHITTVDEGGVALAAIQGLNAKVEARDALIGELSHELAEIKAQLAAMAVAH